ncbi:MAG: M20/M25/M40 family metallo-hydrolase [Acidobacteriota bacterium]|nr:M20/M25/M40 family metallo-hydrolase [Acidobacteriota bacterium]
MILPALRAAFESRVARLEDTALVALRRLVECSSETHDPAGVDRCGALTAQLFASLGFEPRFHPDPAGRRGSHLLLTRPAPGRPRVLMISHLDTVYSAEEVRRRNFAWREEGERIYGPGVIDIKGGTVLMHLLLATLAAEAPRLIDQAEWLLAFNAAEETGSADFPDLVRRAAAPPFLACLVFEHGHLRGPETSSITVSRRGAARFRIEVQGRAAHSGSGHARGASAVRQLARLVEALEALSDPARHLTVNVGRIEGGSAVNTVPERATALVDLRADDPATYEQAVETVLAMAGEGSVRAHSDGFPCSIRVERLPGYPPWPDNPGSRHLADIWRRAARDRGHELVAEHRLGASDGCHLWDLAPTLDGLGPLGDDIHCATHDPARGRRQESLLRRSLGERALIHLEALAALLNPDESP